MTVPVESRLADDQRHLAAAPAEMQTSAGSEWTYTFVMEKQYALTELPSPRDERVVLRQVPPRTVAAIRFSGTWSSRNYEKHEAMLLGALAADEIAVSGPPSLARYNGPVTPWFLRRNEVIVPVNWPMSARRNAPTG